MFHQFSPPHLPKKHTASRPLIIGAFILIASLTLPACSGTAAPVEVDTPAIPAETGEAPSPDSAGNTPQEDRQARLRPEPADRSVFTMTINDGNLEFDPRLSYNADEAQLFTGLYEGLFSYNPYTLEPVYAVARAYNVSEDKLVWTFTLRENARYWNGDRVTAAHFRDAWLSLMNPEHEAPYSSFFDMVKGGKDFRRGSNTDPASVGIEAPSDDTLVITLEHPAAFFPNMLCHHSFSPIHPSQLETVGFAETVPVGNGPFYLYERNADQLVLAKNALYWDEKNVSFKRIVVRWPQDPKEASALWDSGEVQWLNNNADFEALRDRSGISLFPMFATHYYFVRSANTPWQNRNLRRALAISLPWESMRGDYLMPAKTLIPRIPSYPVIEGMTTTNLEEARKLLTDEGHPKGVGLPAIKILIMPSVDARKIAAFMVTAWQDELGIPVEIEEVPAAQYYPALKRDDYTIGSTSWIGDFADPYSFLQMWQADSNLNDARFNDSEYEELISQSMRIEGEERWALLGQAESILLDYGTVLPISHSPAINIINTDEIAGWFPNALDIHPFKYLSWAAWRPLPGVVKHDGLQKIVSGAPSGLPPMTMTIKM